MYILVQHYISDPRTFWSDVRHALPALPPHMTLHHCFPTPDGTHAVCLWEAEAVRDVRAFLETYVGHVSRNLYFQVENASGIAQPSEVELAAPAGSAPEESSAAD
ncbi:MAG TPA: hypothetical protein VFQ39_07745 [Longimicrobium sp.]|nr:hypothetical protein [Longimicrobium sp.]